jgi:hypothetical protein
MHVLTNLDVLGQAGDEGELILVKIAGGNKRTAFLYVCVDEKTLYLRLRVLVLLLQLLLDLVQSTQNSAQPWVCGSEHLFPADYLLQHFDDHGYVEGQSAGVQGVGVHQNLSDVDPVDEDGRALADGQFAKPKGKAFKIG